MKKYVIFFLLPAILFSCKKDNEDGEDNNPSAEVYLNTKAGSVWKYEVTETEDGESFDYDYTLTATGRDTSANNRKYHVYENSDGYNEYKALSGNDYFQLGLEDDLSLELLYLKTNVPENHTWSQKISPEIDGYPVPATIEHKLIGKNINHTVKGKAYTKVMRVQSTVNVSQANILSVNLIIDNYYAPNYGLIEGNMVLKANIFGEVSEGGLHTLLSSADLK